jgi:hypothetical protein
VVKDHVDVMAQHEIEERKVQEELEAVRVENAQIREQIRDACHSTDQKKK